MNLKVFATLFTALALVLSQFFSYPVLAEEYSVTGNGEGSSNNVTVSQDSFNSVQQSNTSEIKNDVKTESNTGGNETSDNSGESSVETGDASTTTVVENSGNTNTASGGCCPTSDSSAQITGNGSNSTNSINSNQTSSTTVSQNNSGTITNNIQVNANTGDNEASDNDGDVSITTGKVNTNIGVYNNMNYSYASFGSGGQGSNLKIAGNGEGSTNEIEEKEDFEQEFFVNNYLNLNNNVNVYANTGSNKAEDNKGKVFLSTGDVYLNIILSNKVNFSKVIADCGCKSIIPSPTPAPSSTPKPSESPSPSSPPSGGCCSPAGPPSEGGGGGGSGGGSGGGGSSSGGSGGSSGGGGGGGQVLGASLPGTGGFSMFLTTIFSLLMMISGVLLRLDYGKTQVKVKKFKASFKFRRFVFTQSTGKHFNWNFPLPPPRYLFTRFTGVPPPLFSIS